MTSRIVLLRFGSVGVCPNERENVPKFNEPLRPLSPEKA